MSTEREHARATTVQEHTVDHDARVPGHAGPSSLLRAPTAPIISALVQRKAERDDNGVADGADQAIAAASSSQGMSLPSPILRKFESSLGTDLSSVRIHTGGESQAAAHAVGAKAYTIGQDVHFGAGHYDPSSGAGEHLLAHEVAHTLQQRGGTPIRQNKLEVSTPFDTAEHEADRAADAMIRGEAATISGFAGVQRKVFREVAAPTTNSDAEKESKLLAAAVQQALPRINTALTAVSKIDLQNATNDVAAAFARAEKSATAGTTDATGQPAADGGTSAALNKTIASQSVVVLGALELPGVTYQVQETSGDSVTTDIRARAWFVGTVLDRFHKVIDLSKAASLVYGQARLDQAQNARDELLSFSSATRAHIIKLMSRFLIAADIVKYLQGDSSELRVQAGPRQDFGSGSDARAEANAQSAVSLSTSLPGPVKDANVNPNAGPVGATFKGGSAGASTSRGLTADLRGEDGSWALNGLTSNGSATIGETTVKVSAGLSQTTSPPTYDGVHWTVAWSITATVSPGGGQDIAKHEASGAKVSADAKVSGTLVKSGTQVFDDQASAQKAYEDGEFELKKMAASSMRSLPDVTAASALKDGESAEISRAGSTSRSVGASMSNVDVNVGVTGGLGDDVKIAKAGTKIVATIRNLANGGANGSIGAPGIGLGGGASAVHAGSSTFEFDLSTEEGKKAYGEWVASPTSPPKPNTPGVRVLSKGSGTFTSDTIRLNVGIGISGSGSTTSTAGEFTETSENGRAKQNTIVGANTNQTTDISPWGSKEARTDSLEITTTTTDGKPAPGVYAIKTSVQGRTDPQWVNEQLRTQRGEANATGKLSGNSSGPTGKWSVEGTYTQAEMDKFEKAVVSGSFTLKSHVNELSDPNANLKAVLADSNADDHAKKAALAKWFSQRGPDAKADLRAVLGPPKMTIALEGDKYLNGANYQAVFEGQRQTLEDRLLDPSLTDEQIKQLLTATQKLYTDQVDRRDHIANPANYLELPNGLRHDLVMEVQANYFKVALLRDRVASRAKEANLGDSHSNPQVSSQMHLVSVARENAQEQRGFAVDARAKHNGALSAGTAASPRSQLDVGFFFAPTQFQNLYASSDTDWEIAQKNMTRAADSEREMFTESCLDDASRSKAIKAADHAIRYYDNATTYYRHVAQKLLKIVQLARFSPVSFKGYDKEFYGTID